MNPNLSIWNDKLTIRQNAENLELTLSAARSLQFRHKLRFLKEFPSLEHLERRQQILKLHGEGVNGAVIGKQLGVTRQHVHQVVRKYCSG